MPLLPCTASLGASSDVNRDSDMPAPAEHTLSHWLHPRQMLSHLRDIDSEASRERQQCSDETLWLRAWTVIAVACLCLLMVHYLKYSNNLREFIPLLESLFGIENSQWKMAWLRSPYRDLIGNVWWGCWQLIGFMLIPMLTIRFILKQRLRDYGWQAGSVKEHWLGYVLLATPIMVFAVIASFAGQFDQFEGDDVLAQFRLHHASQGVQYRVVCPVAHRGQSSRMGSQNTRSKSTTVSFSILTPSASS